MLASLPILLLLAAPPVTGDAAAIPADTLRLEVGSKAVDGRIYAPHTARVRVYVGDGDGSLVSEWTNELTHGDSAGRAIHRWVTKGVQQPGSASPVSWELHQTFDAITLAPLGFVRRSSSGAEMALRIDGRHVKGFKRSSATSPAEPVEVELDRPGFVAAASDLVPLAAGLTQGAVMTAPVWSPSMTRTEMRIFTVLGETDVEVEGERVRAWQVEERHYDDGRLAATWYLVKDIPYMVYGEVPLPDGRVRRMTEVTISAPARQ